MNGTYLSADSVTTPVCSLDGATAESRDEWPCRPFPRISLSLHAGCWLRLMLLKCCILDQRSLSKCHSAGTLLFIYIT